MLLIDIVGRVTGRTFGQTIERCVVRPLALLPISGAETIDDLMRCAPGLGSEVTFEGTAVDVRGRYHPGWCAPHLVTSTAADISQIFDAMIAGTLLLPETLTEMVTLVPLSMAAGDDAKCWTELASLLETRQRVSEAQYSLAEVAWQAFRKATPEALDGLRHGDTSTLPYLAAAVTRFLQEYPWTTDALSRTERRLLELADVRSISLPAVFPRMHDGEDAYDVNDTSMAALAERLSRSSPPLSTFVPSHAARDEDLLGSVTMTDTGRAVLARRQDRIAICGVDRWLGGAHLQGDVSP